MGYQATHESPYLQYFKHRSLNSLSLRRVWKEKLLLVTNASNSIDDLDESTNVCSDDSPSSSKDNYFNFTFLEWVESIYRFQETNTD